MSEKDNKRDYLKRFKARHERLLNDKWASERVDLIGGLAGIRLKKDGTLDLNAPDVVDVDNMHKAFDLCSNAINFGKGNIPTLLGYIPSLILLSKNMQYEQHRFYQVLAEQIGDIPFDKYITKYPAKKGDELENALEALDLAKALLIAFETIKDENLKALVIRELIQGIEHLEKNKGRLECGGFDLSYDGVSEYAEKELKAMEETFGRRNKITKNLYRRDFVTQYIDSEVCDRFFSNDYEQPYTPEKGREWDKHFNDLCDEYGEADYKRTRPDAFYQTVREGLLCHFPITYEAGKIEERDNLLEVAELYGVGSDIIDRASALLEKHILTKEEIKEALQKIETINEGNDNEE